MYNAAFTSLSESYHQHLSIIGHSAQGALVKYRYLLKFLIYLESEGIQSLVILENIENGNESRREWMLKQFENSAKVHERNSKFQFWTHENHAEHIYTDIFIRQKLEYIHNNPVRAGIIEVPEHYLYSSAKNYAGEKGLLEVEILTTKWKTY